MAKLTKRTKRALTDANLTLEAVADMTDAELLAVPGFGPAAVEEIRTLSSPPGDEAGAPPPAPASSSPRVADKAPAKAENKAPSEPGLSPQGTWRPAKTRDGQLIYRNEETGVEIPREVGLSIAEACRRVSR